MVSIYMRLATIVALLSVLSCEQGLDAPQTRARCEGSARAYDELARGAELCDTQHLVADLSPGRVDVRAGQGALLVPLRITKKELRQYCFVDDNSELHKLTMRGDDGAIKLELRAGEACQLLELEQGLYAVRLEHERAGGVDATRDMVHTRMFDESGTPMLRFQVNDCENCDLRRMSWPCHYDMDSDTTQCGYSGNYRRAYFYQSSCDGVLSGANTDCFLHGNFDGADFTQAVIRNAASDHRARLVLGAPLDAESSTEPSHFVGSKFPYAFHSAPDGIDAQVWVHNVSELSGEAPNGASWALQNDSEQLQLDQSFFDTFQSAKAFSGQRAQWVWRGEAPPQGLSNRTLDFARAELVPALRDDESGASRSLQRVSFERSVLQHVQPVRSGNEPYSLSSADFRGAQIVDSVFDATDLVDADFRGAMLQNVQFAPVSGRRVDARGLKLQRATLDNVAFGVVEDNSSSEFGFNLSELQADEASIKSVYMRHAALAGSRWTGASIEGLTATGADLSGAQFSELRSLQGAVWSYSVLGSLAASASGGAAQPFVLSVRPPNTTIDGLVLVGASVNIDMPAAVFSRCNLNYATLEGNFADSSFSGSQFSHAVLGARANFSHARVASTQFTAARIASEAFGLSLASGCDFAGVSFVNAALAGSTFRDSNLSGAHFCGAGTYAGLVFDGVNLTGAAMPVTGTMYPDASRALKPGEERCVGGIDATQRDLLVTRTANFCPDGSVPLQDRDCAGAQWTPAPSNVTPMCCVPARGSDCRQLIPGEACVSPCQCASQVCRANGSCL